MTRIRFLGYDLSPLGTPLSMPNSLDRRDSSVKDVLSISSESDSRSELYRNNTLRDREFQPTLAPRERKTRRWVISIPRNS